MMATDAYGLDDVSLLSAPAQQTAKQIQQAFENSLKGAGRQAQRYNLPTLANFNEDAALARAQTAAGLINSNQQQQNLIDALNHTPHGFDENLAKYLPYLGLGNQLSGTLFGRNNFLSENGLVGAAQKGWDKIMHPGGSEWMIDPNGQIMGVGDYNNYFNGADYGPSNFDLGAWGNYFNAADYGPSAADLSAFDWTVG